MTYRRCICHPDDLPGVGISSGWVTANSLCHPDDILFHFMSFGWLNWGWFLIRMSYGNVIMSSGWDTLPFLSHPDEIANFDFPQHAVALQRFRNNESDGVSNHQPRDILLNCLSRRSSKETSKLRSEVHRWIPRTNMPVTRKMFSFDDIIMVLFVMNFEYRYNNFHSKIYISYIHL